ncbi:MAG: V-type ATP synthase subunit E [Candidatus Jordarchaeum sp.]|uniref:V-type ATP synthase subunit E n=1 Tax=Candidatus Jordarchaeum sp. TaxID=2823881 RepID=UPI00404B3034
MSEELIDEKIEKMEEEPEDKRLRRIVKKIKEDAKTRANQIIEDAEEKASAIIEEAKRKTETSVEKILRKGKESAEQIKKRKIGETKLKVKQRKMKLQEELIEATLNKAQEKLQNLSTSKDYKNILEKLVLRSAIGLNGGELEIILPKQHKNIELSLADIAKKVEEQTKNKTTLKIAKEEAEAVGGCIVRKSDKSISIDNTFKAIMERKIEKIRTIAAKIFQ